MRNNLPSTWHDQPLSALTARLATDVVHGLVPEEAAIRLQQAGPNALRKGQAISPLALLAGQFRSLVIWVLIGAALVSVALGELVDGLAILTIVLLNAMLGFFQEYRAEQAVAALARLADPRARVVRGGHAEVIAAAEIVRGDILLLDAGDLVAADARLLDASALRTNEAPLTGESQPVEKQAGSYQPETPLAERHNMVFLGTSIAGGSGRALVVATGMDTEVGHIATLLETARRDATPLQRRLDQVARRLLWACLGIVALIFTLGLLRAVAPFELFLSAVSLAVAAIPEGLPAVVTIALALGVQRMARRHVLVRRLPAVETLGCAQVICTDKTGTLTVGVMTARQVVTSERRFTVSGEGHSTAGMFCAAGDVCTAAEEALLVDVLRAAAACNDAELRQQDNRPAAVGDPTEVALLVVAAKREVTRDRIESEMPRLGTLPKEASIGVAMGVTGTEVTKEAAAIIITDDNFASIVAAVEEGRGIYDNIAKTLAYLLGGNTGELAIMFIAALVGWPLPLLPIQLLWINLVTDGLPALALATDPIDPGVLTLPPRRPEAQLVDWDFCKRIVVVGCLTAGVALSAFAYEWYIDKNLAQARDAAFSVLVMAELLRAFGARSDTRTVWQVGLWSNMPLFVIVVASFALQLAIHHLPALQALFGTAPLSCGQGVAWLMLGSVPLGVLELRKVWRRWCAIGRSRPVASRSSRSGQATRGTTRPCL